MRQVIFAAMTAAACLTSVAVHSQEAVPVAAASKAASPFKKQLEKGYRLKEQKRSGEAIAVFAAVLAKDPGNHAALIELGYLHAGLKHYNSAIKYLAAASAQDPSSMRLHMDLGYAEQAAKKYAAAGDQFQIVAEHKDEFQDQAQKALATVKAPSPAVIQADAKQRHLREQGYAELKRGDKAAAAKTFEEASIHDPKDAASLKQLGFIHFDAGDLAAAADNFQAVRALEPSDYVVALQLGYTYERLQKKERAREQFSAALASGDEKVHGAAQAALQASGGAVPPSTSSSL